MGVIEDSKKFRDFALAFLKEAKEDVASAEDLLENKRYSRTVYFCQQCVEKSVKALLEMERIFVVEHDLSAFFVRFIYNNIEYKNLKKELEIIIESLDYFKGEWIKTRYPKEQKGKVITPSELYEENDANSAIAKAKDTLNKVKEIFDKKFNIKIDDKLHEATKDTTDNKKTEDSKTSAEDNTNNSDNVR